MGVMLQTFYWDCPRVEAKEFQWWNAIREQIPALAKTGFSALWLPPVHKAANLMGPSMGYDPYDYYDLGEFDQKGSVPTWFGSKADLLSLIKDAHQNSMPSSPILSLTTPQARTRRKSTRSPVNRAGRSSSQRAGSSRATGNVFTQTCMSRGTRWPSVICPISPTAIPTSIPNY